MGESLRAGRLSKALDQVLTDDVASMFKDLGIDPVGLIKHVLIVINTFRRMKKTSFRAAPDEIQGTPSFMIGGRKVVG